MDYNKIYLSIIRHAKSQTRSKCLGYYESHHIIPKSLGGSNKKENLVLLTAREHFLCHYLLVKMHKNNKLYYNKMLHAFVLLKGSNRYQSRYVNSRLYESLKKEYAVIRSEVRTDKPMSAEQKQKISQTMKGHILSSETKMKISEKAKTRVRKPWSDEYKKRHSEIMKEKHRWQNIAG
jgi:hypothetical protein